MYVCVCVCVCVCIHMRMSISHSVVSDSLRHHILYPARFLCACDFPGKNTEAGSLSLLQGSFPTQGLNLDLLHCRQILYLLIHRGKWKWKSLVVSDSLPCHRLSVYGILQAKTLEWVAFPISRNGTQVSHLAGGFFTSWATRTPYAVHTMLLMPTLSPHQIQFWGKGPVIIPLLPKT